MISNKFNEFFVNIRPNLAKKILGIDPLNSLGGPERESPVTCSEIHNISVNLKNGAPGFDEINTSILKLISEHIVDPLVYLCNLSLQQGIFSKRVKISQCPSTL